MNIHYVAIIAGIHEIHYVKKNIPHILYLVLL